MSKELELAKKLPTLVAFMESEFKGIDGPNKVAMLKTAAAYYDGIISAESVRAVLRSAIENISK